MSTQNKRNQGRQIRRKNRRNLGRRSRNPPTLGGVDLPHINQKPVQTRCIRYYGSPNFTSGTAVNFSVADIRSILGAVTNTSTTFVPLIDSFRIRRIGYSAVLQGTAGSATVSFAWEGPNVPDIQDTTFIGIGVPITRSYYPPPNTSVSWWYDNGATSVNLFSVLYTGIASGIADVYLDIDFEYIIQDGASAPITLAVAATYTGIAVIELPVGTQVFVPVGLSTVH